MLRPISNLCNLNKIMETIISELVISDMQSKLDPSQFGNQKHKSIQHYLVKLLNRILTSVDNNSKGEINAVLCMFIDWKQAYSRQCHTLGIESFIKNGVRPSLIPLLISYFVCEMAWITVQSKEASWWRSHGSQSGQLGVPLPNKQ